MVSSGFEFCSSLDYFSVEFELAVFTRLRSALVFWEDKPCAG